MLLIDKEEGPTSHDIVREVRGLLGGARVGHTGTLDPMATGLLVLLVGRATRLAPYVPGEPKVYSARVLLGRETETMDMQGSVLREKGFAGDVEEVKKVIEGLVGEWEQTPPAFSAVKHRGRPAYSYARRGEQVELAARRVRIYRMEMTAFRRIGDMAEADFVVECSPGTYVRELASRIGTALSCGGTLSRLRREASGPFKVVDAMTLEGVRRHLVLGEACIRPMHEALGGMRMVEVKESCAGAVVNGAPIEEGMLLGAHEGVRQGEAVAVMGGGTLLAVHRVARTSPFLSRPLRVVGAIGEDDVTG